MMIEALFILPWLNHGMMVGFYNMVITIKVITPKNHRIFGALKVSYSQMLLLRLLFVVTH